jgi:hypothetical protein
VKEDEEKRENPRNKEEIKEYSYTTQVKAEAMCSQKEDRPYVFYAY